MSSLLVETHAQTQIRKAGFGLKRALLSTMLLAPLALIWGCAGVASSRTSPTSPSSHSVTLSWNASTSTVSGYNIYRNTLSGGTYVRINSSPVAGLNYTDSTVQSGTTYYYVTTAVDNTGMESAFSNQVSAAIP
jgi:hypothetical protein